MAFNKKRSFQTKYSENKLQTNGLVAPSSMFSNAWLVTKNTMELLTEIQASFYITLQHLLKDVSNYDKL